MSFHYKCINSHLDEADYIHFLRTFLFFFFLTIAIAHPIIIHNPHPPPPPKCCKCSKREPTSNLKKKERKKVFFSLIQRSFLCCEILHWFKHSRSVVGRLQFNSSTLIQLGFIASKTTNQPCLFLKRPPEYCAPLCFSKRIFRCDTLRLIDWA